MHFGRKAEERYASHYREPMGLNRRKLDSVTCNGSAQVNIPPVAAKTTKRCQPSGVGLA